MQCNQVHIFQYFLLHRVSRLLQKLLVVHLVLNQKGNTFIPQMKGGVLYSIELEYNTPRTSAMNSAHCLVHFDSLEEEYEAAFTHCRAL